MFHFPAFNRNNAITNSKSVDNDAADTPLIKPNRKASLTNCLHHLSFAYIGLMFGIFSQLASFSVVFLLFNKFQSSNLCFVFQLWCIIETAIILSISVMVSSLSTTDKKQHKVAALVTFFSLLGLHISFFAFAAVMELEVSHKVIYAVISLVGQGLVSLAVWNERDDDHIDEDEEQGSATFVAPLLMQGTVPLLNVWDGGSDYADEEESTAAAEGTEEV